MEALWIFPLYFLCPVVGIVLLISGIFQYSKKKNKSRILVGAILISLPIAHIILLEGIQSNYEKNIVGDYMLEQNNQIVLKVKNDGTFELSNLAGLTHYGVGKWDIYNGDLTTLDLHFHDVQETEVSFEMFDRCNRLQLTSGYFKNKELELRKYKKE